MADPPPNLSVLMSATPTVSFHEASYNTGLVNCCIGFLNPVDPTGRTMEVVPEQRDDRRHLLTRPQTTEGLSQPGTIHIQPELSDLRYCPAQQSLWRVRRIRR